MSGTTVRRQWLVGTWLAALIAGGTCPGGGGYASATVPSTGVRPAQMSTPCDLTYVGVAGYCGDGGPLEDSRLAAPRDVAVLPDRGLLIADGQNSVIREVSAANRTISTVAGIGILGATPPSHPAGVEGVALVDPRGVTALPDGSFAVADPGLHAVLLVTPDGLVRTLLDHRTVTAPIGVSAVGADLLAVADAGARRVLEVDLSTGTTHALASRLAEPWGLATDPTAPGDLIVGEAAASAQTSHGVHSVGDVVRLDADGMRTVIAGPGAPGDAGALRFERVAGIAVRSDGVVLVADRHVVYAIHQTGAVAQIADGLGQAEGIAVDGDELEIADSANNRIVGVPAFLPDELPPCNVCTESLAAAPVGQTRVVAPKPVPQAPGAAVCNQGTLPQGIKAVQGLAGRHGAPSRIHVNFTLVGWLQVALAHAGRGAEQSIYRQYLSRAPPHGTVFVSTRQHGRWYVRVRAPGGCHQTTGPFSL